MPQNAHRQTKNNRKIQASGGRGKDHASHKSRSRGRSDNRSDSGRGRGRSGGGRGGPGGWFGGFLRRSLKLAVLVMIWLGVLFAGLVAYYATDLPDIQQVTQQTRRPSLTLLADNGEVVARFGDVYGERVTLKDVPTNLTHAIIAIEDRRFYDHFGIDVLGIIRAMFRNVTSGRLVQGGSTLTQQLAKNLFLSPEQTFSRKMKEMILALWLEHTYTKDQILTAYLNRVYFGAGNYGVDAAAQSYFGKPAHDLDLRECAIIAGLLRAPSKLSPATNPDGARERASVVLMAMQEAGYITEAERNAAMADVPLPRKKPGSAGDGRYFADWVLEQASAIVGEVPQDLIIKTTLDMNLQRMAEQKLNDVLARNVDKKVSQGAVVTLAEDGAVRVLVGGRNYDESQFNRATQAERQPGSSFKPVVYLAAIEKGLQPEDVFEDAPLRIGKWSPENYDGTYHGPMTARAALAQSVNTVAVRVLQQAGLPAVLDTARALGLTSALQPDLSIALGSNLANPLEMTAIYATLASGGRAVTPYGIKEILSRQGQVLYVRQEARMPQVIPFGAVETLVSMMRDVLTEGTGKRADIGRPAAGKTGTSSDYRDAWFLGFTADFTTGVWLGNDDNSPMKKVAGGGLPAEVWHNFMSGAEQNLPSRELLPGANFAAQAGGVSSVQRQGAGDTLGDFIRGIFGN